MALKYQGQLNLGNAAFGTEKTITANEVVETVDAKYIAEEVCHINPLLKEVIVEQVLAGICQAVARLMGMGFAVQLKSGQDVAMRIYPDIHLKGGNINLARAQELIPGTTDLTMENAAALIDKAGGVTVRVRAEVEQKFTDLLLAEGASVTRVGIVEKAYVERKDGDNNGTGGGSTGGNGGTGGGNGGTTGGGDAD